MPPLADAAATEAGLASTAQMRPKQKEIDHHERSSDRAERGEPPL